MKVPTIVILCISSILAAPQNSRIIGGTAARAGEFPWQVAVFATTTEQQHFCGGVLINNQWVLTAAQCVTNPKIFAVHLGTIHSDPNQADPNRKIVATHTTITHPDFNPETLENDIALIRFHMPIDFTDYIQPIDISANITADAILIASGWGQIDDMHAGHVDYLNYVTLVAISTAECQITYGSAIKDTMLCAVGNNNEGTCIGDTGGPLVSLSANGKYALAGIASFLSYNGCEASDPSGFTRATAYADWVDTAIEDYENENGK